MFSIEINVWFVPQADMLNDSTAGWSVTMPCFAAEDQRRVPNQMRCARHMQVMPGALPRGQLQSLEL
jgi:hypothetical protein